MFEKFGIGFSIMQFYSPIWCVENGHFGFAIANCKSTFQSQFSTNFLLVEFAVTNDKKLQNGKSNASNGRKTTPALSGFPASPFNIQRYHNWFNQISKIEMPPAYQLWKHLTFPSEK